DQRIAERLDLVGDRLEKAGTLLGGPAAIVRERLGGGLDRAGRLGGRSVVKRRLQRRACRGISCTEGLAARAGDSSGDQALAMQHHSTSWCSTGEFGRRSVTRPYWSRFRPARS